MISAIVTICRCPPATRTSLSIISLHNSLARFDGFFFQKCSIDARHSHISVAHFYIRQTLIQVTEKSALHLMFGLPARAIRYALGYQMFGFQEKAGRQQQQTRSANMSSTSSTSSFTTNARAGELYGRANTAGATAGGEIPPPAATPALRGRVRLSGFGQVGMGGSVALCDPASGLAFAMVTNKVSLSTECRKL